MTVPLKVDNLVKTFRHPMKIWEKIQAVDNISFSINSGDIVGFVGHNGAGKTTTIRMAMGFIRPTEGSVSLFGMEPGALEAKKKIGFLPERPYFYTQLTATELLKYFAGISGIERKHIPDLVKRIIKRVGLEHDSDRKLSGFSKGMLQRIGIAQAIIHNPEFIIMDEPMSGLDPIGRKEVKNIILDLKKEGKTVLFSSHILSDIENLSDKVLIIERGKIRSYGKPEDIISEKEISYRIVFSPPENERDSVFAFFKGVTVVKDRYQITVETEDEMNRTLGTVIEKGYTVHEAGGIFPTLEDIVFSSLEGKDD